MNSSSAPDQAAHWAARLDAGPLTRTEAEALTRWLDEAPGHEGLLEEMQQVQLKVREVLPEMAASGRLPRSRAKLRIGPRLAWAGSLAAVLVVALAWFGRGPDRYDTVAGQRQTITLADGTLVEMNAQTGIDVRLDGGDRELRKQRAAGCG
jgi:transmembrane sensor